MPGLPALDARFRRSEHVADRRIEEEVLLIPIRTDPKAGLSVLSLNVTAALIWELMDGTRTLTDLVAAVCGRFDVDPETARTDVQACCQELVACGAVEPVEAPEGP